MITEKDLLLIEGKPLIEIQSTKGTDGFKYVLGKFEAKEELGNDLYVVLKETVEGQILKAYCKTYNRQEARHEYQVCVSQPK